MRTLISREPVLASRAQEGTNPQCSRTIARALSSSARQMVKSWPAVYCHFLNSAFVSG